jgi:hypothetical protein
MTMKTIAIGWSVLPSRLCASRNTIEETLEISHISLQIKTNSIINSDYSDFFGYSALVRSLSSNANEELTHT